MFGGPELGYHQTYSARVWLSIVRTPYPTQNPQRKQRTDLQTGEIKYKIINLSCKNNIKSIYLTFIHCTCKYEQQKQAFLSANYEKIFPNKNLKKNYTELGEERSQLSYSTWVTVLRELHQLEGACYVGR